MKFIKSRLTGNTKIFLVDELRSYSNKSLKSKIDLFDKYLCISKEGTDYDGLNDRITNALNNWANSVVSPKELLNSLSITEQYLKSLVKLFDEKEYNQIKGKGEEFANIIKLLDMTILNRNGNLNLTLTAVDENRGISLEKKFLDDSNQYRWAVAYSFRNIDAHAAKKYNQEEAIVFIKSILYVLLETTWKYKAEIESLYTEEFIFAGMNKDGYFNKITKEFEDKNLHKTFVIMSIINEKHKNSNTIGRSNDGDEEDEEETNLISSLDIMKDLDNKSTHIKLVGEAGLGKSRLMRYLHYTDAKKGTTYPVYIELRELSDLKLSIIELIEEKAGLNEEACNLLMQEGGLSLYLDGMNELLCTDNEKKIISRQISDIAETYPKTKILVSDRENSYITIKSFPTYLLVKLDEPLVHDFISKNSKSKEIEDKVKKILNEEKYLYDIIRTPFMVEALINLVENNEYDSSITNTSKLKAKFVESLIRREAEEKLEGRASKIKLLLTHLFIEDKKWDDKISLFSETLILFRFAQCMECYKFQVDSVEMLELIAQMGILAKLPNKDEYAFANEIYKSYFLDKSFDTVIELFA